MRADVREHEKSFGRVGETRSDLFMEMILIPLDRGKLSGGEGMGYAKSKFTIRTLILLVYSSP